MDQLHGDEGHSLGFVDLVDDGDVRMLECGGGLRFLHEPALAIGVGHQLRRQDLEGDLAVQPHVDGAVDDPHAAAADFVDDTVVREGATNHRIW